MQYNGLLDLYNKEKEKNKECEVTLKQTQKSWYEDSKDIEEYRIIHDTLTNKILDLENELKIEKETSHFIQSQLDIANAKLLEEKEERKKAEHNYDELTKTTGKLEIELEEEKEKNKELEKKYKIEKLKNVLDEQCLKEALEETDRIMERMWRFDRENSPVCTEVLRGGTIGIYTLKS